MVAFELWGHKRVCVLVLWCKSNSWLHLSCGDTGAFDLWVYPCIGHIDTDAPGCGCNGCVSALDSCVHPCIGARGLRVHGCHCCVGAFNSGVRGGLTSPLSRHPQHSNAEFASVAALLAHYSGSPGGCFCRLAPGRRNPGYEERDPGGGASAFGEAAWAPAAPVGVQHERG